MSEKYLCPNCGDDRTGKGSLIDAGTSGQAFCNELCVMEWQQKRMAELERHNALLLAVAKKHQGLLEEISSSRVGIMGSFGSVCSGNAFSCGRIDKMYKEVEAAIDGGALEESE